MSLKFADEIVTDFGVLRRRNVSRVVDESLALFIYNTFIGQSPAGSTLWPPAPSADAGRRKMNIKLKRCKNFAHCA